MSNFSLNPNSHQRQLVGQLNLVVVQQLFGVTFPSADVYMYPGAIKHIQKNHSQIFNQYHHLIPIITSNPDYMGQNPTEPDSIELYKVIGDHLLLAIKLDPSGYLYLSSFYDLNNGPYKIQNRLQSGRIKRC